MSDVRPIFVLGSARSGTSMLGVWLGSDPKTYDAGEYNAFVATYRDLPRQLQGLQPPWFRPEMERYLAEVQRFTAEFVTDVARGAGCDSFVDHTPMNVTIAGPLAELFPDALFVLALRHYSGVVQSLARTGWTWVPPSPQAAATIWRDAYVAALALPDDRTVVASYDALCADPATALDDLRKRLAGAGVRVDDLDDSVLRTSHAHIGDHERPTLLDESGLAHPIPSVDLDAWTREVHQSVWPVVAQLDEVLRDRFGDGYQDPAGFVRHVATLPATSAARPPDPDLSLASDTAPALRSIEFVVDDLARAEELLSGLMGLPVLARYEHGQFDADMLLLGAGDVAITVLAPTDRGTRPPFPSPTPRLSQLVFGVEGGEEIGRLRGRLAEGGAAVTNVSESLFYLPEGMVEAVFGTAPMFVVTEEAERE